MTTNGKGSKIRGTDPASRKRYADGWERVFGGKRKRVHKNTKRVRP